MNEKQIELLNQRTRLQLSGGTAAINKQHAKGKMTARERIFMLLDRNSFSESGLFVKHRSTEFGLDGKVIPGDGVITGTGTINGRRVYITSQDFMVQGGSLGEMHAGKICAAQQNALRTGSPIICINDSGGARIQEGIDALSGYGRIFYNNTAASGVVPQIAVIMGPCAGGAVYSPALMDFVFIVKKTGQMYITGEQVVKAVTGEQTTNEELGGALTHNSISGCAHFFAENEQDCFDQIKRLLGFLPQNNREDPPVYACSDPAERRDEELNSIVPDNPRHAYNMLDIIRTIADNHEFMEYQKLFAPNIITGFIRLAGKSIGVIANQPLQMAGCLDINASDKAARFIRTCDSFNIPLLTLEDVPGYLPGKKQEHGGIIRHGAKLLYAYSEAAVPKITLITRKAYGGAYIGMCSKHLGADAVFAWPGAEIAVMGAEGAAVIIFAKDIKEAKDPGKMREQLIAEYNDRLMNPYTAAARGYVDDIILPSETRARLISAFSAFEGKKEIKIQKRHGNIPL